MFMMMMMMLLVLVLVLVVLFVVVVAQDHKLLKLVEQYGHGKWTLVAKHMDCGRTGLQCRQRYLGKLDPTIKEGPWTDEEDRRIVAAQSRLGNRWQEIAKYLDGRSWSAAHARWFSTLQVCCPLTPPARAATCL